MRSIPALTVLTACASYAPGSFTSGRSPFAGHRVTTGCLDVAVKVVRENPGDSPVITYHFGNRCNHAQLVDLGAVVVTGRTTDGTEVALTPFDPGGEIEPLPLDGRLVGRENIEYQTSPSGADLASLCVAAGAITGPGAPPMPPVCFRFTSGRLAEVTP